MIAARLVSLAIIELFTCQCVILYTPMVYTSRCRQSAAPNQTGKEKDAGSGADAVSAGRLSALNTGRVAGTLLSNGETGNLPSASECLVSKRRKSNQKTRYRSRTPRCRRRRQSRFIPQNRRQADRNIFPKTLASFVIILFVAAIAPWPAAAQSGNSAVVNSCASILATTNNWCSVSRCGSLSVSFFRGATLSRCRARFQS